MKEESLLLLSDLQKLINQVVLIDYTIIILGDGKMNFTDEKDYIMRMIKEMVRVLFSLAFGKKYVSVELEKENKYEVSGKNFLI